MAAGLVLLWLAPRPSTRLAVSATAKSLALAGGSGAMNAA